MTSLRPPSALDGAHATRSPRTLWDLVCRQAASRPHAPAAHDVDHGYTYAEAHRRALRVAAALAMCGVAPGDRVLVCTDRTAQAVLALLGVVAAGATPVPIEVDGPIPRFERILAAADAQVALADSAGAATLDGQPVRVLDLADALARDAAGEPRPGADIAYLLFTSGSTGVPKGVQITRGNLLALLDGASQWDTSTDSDVWASLSAFTFDASIWEMWRPISTGGQVFVLPRVAQLDADELHTLIEEHAISGICQTPTAAAFFADVVGKHGPPATLRRLLLGGERLDMAMLAPFAEAVAADQLAVFNMYGPTETTVYATAYRVTAHDIAHERRALIGRALPHVRVLIDRSDTRGVGELLISGPGVSAGYRGDPELTADRFCEVAGLPTYRTGDMVRDAGDGVLEFLGRSGGFVKVRGYRVELGEVVAALCAHPHITQAVATVTDLGAGATIVCAAVAKPGATPSDVELRRHAARHLPSYMRPARIELFDAFPQLASTKLDERAVVDTLLHRLAGPS